MTETQIDLTAIRRAATDDVIHRRDLERAGLSRSLIARRCQPNGPWQRLMPGVVQLGNTEPSRRQLVRAAAAYAGEDAVITGLDALRAHGAPVQPTGPIHLLIPASRRLRDLATVHIERTTRLFSSILPDELRYAPPARATLDAARCNTPEDELDALLSVPVRQGMCSVAELRAELDNGSQRGSAAPRAALANLGQGNRAAVHAFAMRLAARTPIPAPRWNITVYDRLVQPVATVDSWWDEVAMAWTISKHRVWEDPALQALRNTGVLLVHSTPFELHADPEGVVRKLSRAFLLASKRRRPAVHAEQSVRQRPTG
ncbi:hypothetical protein EV191_12127 [Tamaricihabitans halophyticus]|uniref:Transcriptional regulator, AbiEi antitoxin, Type IV TA system n=1 Tax=Tamaricihabitans halophyticus TaxID=1262583 RepID=A0A4R2Q4S8_9PSEU|nr:hypothetical protein [Tamaricihabitans halophyticus]TCP43630.1 hypothetical protein EV191_12127 [Tamaricihabitans halophyticus]